MLSVVWFWLALLSKEPAILLPAMLAWLFVLVPMRSERRMLALRGLRPHGVLLSAYLLFVFAWLRAGSLGSNVFSLSSSFTLVTENLNRLMLWSFNLPWSWHSGYRHLPVIGWLVLGFVAVAVILGWLRIAWKGTAERRLLWLALGWFGIAAIPLLFLLELKPYYLLFPLLGFSLAVGVGLTELARSFRGERARTLVLVAFLGTQAILSARLSDQDRRQHPLLGGSALLNEQVLREVRQAIPDGAATHLIILDSPGSSAYWSFAQGGLFRLGLSDPKLRVSFASLGVDFSSIPADTRTYVFRLADGVLSQVTESFRNNPSQFLSSEEDFNYSPLEYDLIRVSPSRVVAGRDRYRLEVPGWKNQIVELQFRLDDGPIGIVRVQLDATAGTSYYVSDQTPRGRYRFFAVRLPGQPIWRRSSEAVVAVE